MRFPRIAGPLLGLCIGLGAASGAFAFDEDAAKKLAKKNDCFKCHAIDKTKKGPSLKKIAEKEKAKPDIHAKLMKHLKTSPKVKLEDGSEEDHKAIEGTDPEIRNLVEWILAQ